MHHVFDEKSVAHSVRVIITLQQPIHIDSHASFATTRRQWTHKMFLVLHTILKKTLFFLSLFPSLFVSSDFYCKWNGITLFKLFWNFPPPRLQSVHKSRARTSHCKWEKMGKDANAEWQFKKSWEKGREEDEEESGSSLSPADSPPCNKPVSAWHWTPSREEGQINAFEADNVRGSYVHIHETGVGWKAREWVLCWFTHNISRPETLFFISFTTSNMPKSVFLLI